MDKRTILRALGMTGAVAATGLAIPALAKDKKPKKPKEPKGKPFKLLVEAVGELRAKVHGLIAGEIPFESLRVDNSDQVAPSTILFGPTDLCTIGIDPDLSGLIESDPGGFRLLGVDGLGCRLLFGPTDECTIGIDPANDAGGIDGLLLRDPNGVRILNPDEAGRVTLNFGPGDECAIVAEPASAALRTEDLRGLSISDPGGLNVRNPRVGEAARLTFGESEPETGTFTCYITAEVGQGVSIWDPNGVNLRNPQGGTTQLSFGGPSEIGECRIRTSEPDDAGNSLGLIVEDPFGLNIRNPNPKSATQLSFGATGECRLRTSELNDAGNSAGLILEDPFGLNIRNPDPDSSATQLSFGDNGLCRISVGPGGMAFTDPRGFSFLNNVNVEGNVTAQNFEQMSSAAFKENIAPIQDPLGNIDRLQGVRFDWKPEHGGAPSIGFIAEEVAEVFPELVNQNEDGSARSMAYANLVAVTVEGIKAQQKQIQRLESDKGSLESEVSTLRSQLQALASQVSRIERAG